MKKARYYNLQLWRNGEKILSTWPSTAKLKIGRAWTYQGHHFKLRKGRYTWVVWPGFGAPAKGRYGRSVGQSSFLVR